MQKFVKAFSMVVSTALCVGMLTQYNITYTQADSSNSDIDYAIGLIGKFATYTSGNYSNDNHSMAPVAVGGDLESHSMSLTDNQRVKYFVNSPYDLVIGGYINNDNGNKVTLGIDSTTDFRIAVVEGKISPEDFNVPSGVVPAYKSNAAFRLDV